MRPLHAGSSPLFRPRCLTCLPEVHQGCVGVLGGVPPFAVRFVLLPAWPLRWAFRSGLRLAGLLCGPVAAGLRLRRPGCRWGLAVWVCCPLPVGAALSRAARVFRLGQLFPLVRPASFSVFVFSKYSENKKISIVPELSCTKGLRLPELS